MATRMLPPPEVVSLEAEVDAFFDGQTLPTKDYLSSIWHVYTVWEDLNRLALVDVAKALATARPGIGPRSAIAGFVTGLDQSKYGLRQALALCKRRLPATTDHRLGASFITNEGGLRTKELLDAANEYAAAGRIFASYHAGYLQIDRDDQSGLLSPRQDATTIGYSALEYLLGSTDSESNAFAQFVSAFLDVSLATSNSPELGTEGGIALDIVERARIKRGRIRYTFVQRVAAALFQIFNGNKSPLLEGWAFPWSTADEARRYFAALHAICIYHFLSIHFAAVRAKLLGLGIQQLCLQIAYSDLTARIQLLTRLPQAVIEAITDVITIGFKTESPDPALQPLVPLANNEVMIPCLLVISSNWQRNLLSLHARLFSESFDKASSIFEKRMIGKQAEAIPPWYKVLRNYNLLKEEIDILVIDPENKSILVAELRWMLQPGDVREVLNRKNALLKKVVQAARKRDRLVESLPAALIQLGYGNTICDWTVNSIVVVDGYAGTKSQEPTDIPIVPTAVFTQALSSAPSLERAHAFLCSPLWLPRDGEDFATDWIPHTFCGKVWNRSKFRFGERSYFRETLGGYIHDNINRGSTELRSIIWR